MLPKPIASLAHFVLQRYWRWSRGLTLGAQGLVIDADSRVLLVLHGYKPGWSIPGGGVEFGETALAALTRELAEETGVVPTAPPELYGLYSNAARFPGDHVAFYLVRQWERAAIPAPNREIVAQDFFALDRLPQPLSPGTQRRLAEVFHAAPRDAIW